MKPLTQTRLKQLLRYDPETGFFFWRVARRPRIQVGMCAGWPHPNGYWYIKIDGQIYAAHRLVWFHERGCFPKELNHKNRDRSDNRIANLREATRIQSSANRKTREGSQTGLKGVMKHYNRWVAAIGRDGKSIYLGSFSTPEAAHAAYCEAARKLHGEFFNPG